MRVTFSNISGIDMTLVKQPWSSYWGQIKDYVAFWYNFADIFISGATTFIKDKTEGKQTRELLTQNGVTGQLFQGEAYNFTQATKQYLTLSKDLEFADDTAWTLCFRVKNTATANYKGLLGHNYTGGEYARIMIKSLSEVVPGIHFYNDANNSVSWKSGIGVIPQEGVIETYVIKCDGSDADNLELFVNNASFGLQTLADTACTFNKIASTGSATTFFFDGVIYEIAAFKRELTYLELGKWHHGLYVGNYEMWQWFGGDYDSSPNAYNMTRVNFDGTSVVSATWKNFKNIYGYGVRADTTVIPPKMSSETPTVDIDNVPLVFSGQAAMHLIQVDANTIKARDNVYELIKITDDIVGNDYYTGGTANNITKANLAVSERNNQYYDGKLYFLSNTIIIPTTIHPIFNIYTKNNKKGLNYLSINYNSDNFPTLTIETFQITNADPVGCTGLAYNKYTHELIIANYNTKTAASIRVMHRRERGVAYGSKTYTDYNIFLFIQYIEGVGYDANNKIFYVWGGDRASDVSGSYLDSEIIIAAFRLIAGSIVLVNIIRYNDLGDGVPGMCSWDYELNGLWVKPYVTTGGAGYNKYAKLWRINLFDEWELIKEVDCKELDNSTTCEQESIASSEFDTDLWGALHNKTKITQWGNNGLVKGSWDNPNYHYYHASSPAWCEGIIVDPTDQTIWYNADNSIHNGGTPIADGNAIWHIDPLHTYNKNLFFPRMIGWDKGKLDTNVAIRDEFLYLINSGLTGIWLSPVIDFSTYTMQRTLTNYSYVNNDSKTITMTFRGSNTTPDTTEDKSFALSFWDANGAGDGWGTTVPGAYQSTVPALRYIQMKITIT